MPKSIASVSLHNSNSRSRAPPSESPRIRASASHALPESTSPGGRPTSSTRQQSADSTPRDGVSLKKANVSAHNSVRGLPLRELSAPAYRPRGSKASKGVVSLVLKGNPAHKQETGTPRRDPKSWDVRRSERKEKDGKRAEHLTRAISQHAKGLSERGPYSDQLYRMMAAMTMPDCANIILFGDAYSTAPVAAVCPKTIQQVAFNTSDATISIPNTDQVAFVFRNPFRAAVVYDSNPTAAASSYTALGLSALNATAPSAPSKAWSVEYYDALDFVPLQTPFYIPSSSANYFPHGQKLYCGSTGSADTRRWVWIEGAQTWIINTSSSSAYTIVPQFRVDLWNGTNVQEGIYAVKASTYGSNISTVLNFSGMAPGYYAVSMGIESMNAAAATIVTINSLIIGDGGISHFCHLSMAGLNSNDNKVDNYRISAVSSKYTNASPQIALSGMVAAAQLPAAVHWVDFINSGGSYGTISQLSGAQTFSVADGAYSYLKPSSLSDAAMNQDSEISDGVLYDVHYPLKNSSDFLVQYVEVALNTDGYAQMGQFTMNHMLQFRTTDQWMETQIPPPNDPLFQKALILLRDIPQHYTNDFHIGDIWEKIKSAVSAIAPYAVPAAKFALENFF